MALRPSRRLFRYSLRTLLVLVTVFCVWLGWQANIVRKRKAVVAELEVAGGVITRRAEVEAVTGRVVDPSLPFWRYWMGDDDVPFIHIQERELLEMGANRADAISRILLEAETLVTVDVPGEFGIGYVAIPYSEWRGEHPTP